MIGKTRVGLKYFFWGMVIGIFFAPGSGKETRAKLFGPIKDMVFSIVGSIWKAADSRQS